MKEFKFNKPIVIAIQIAIIIIVSEQVLSGKCPEPETVYPCTCSQEIDRISCIKFNQNDFNSSYTLPQIFESLSNSLEDSDKSFTELLIANTKMIELGENVFSDITFEKIDIYENNLTRIHLNSFGPNYQTVKQLYMNCLTLRNYQNQQNYSLFNFLSSFINLEKVTLDLGLDSLTAVPDYAFQPLNNLESKLREINLNGVISSVGQFAFSQLTNLQKLKINSQIDYISNNSFLFNTTSTTQLNIDFSNNMLIGSSFENDPFSNSKRAISLNLANNRIKFLDQAIFEPFFEANSGNNLSLSGNTLSCIDCRSYWLIEQKSQIIERIGDAICQNGKSIWNYDWNCPKNSCYIKKLSVKLILILIIMIKFFLI